MQSPTPILHDPSAAPAANARAAGHETADARLKPIAIFLMVLAGACAVIQVAVWYGMRLMQHDISHHDPAPSPVAAKPQLPPEPRLQGSPGHPTFPHEDLATLHARWNETLNTYGAISDQPGQAHIPIARAMQMIAERGLPPASQSTTRPATGMRGAP